MNWYKQAKAKIIQKNGIKIRKGQFFVLPNRKNSIIKKEVDKDIVN